MGEPTALDRRYLISVYGPNEANGAVVFSFGPKGLQQQRTPGEPARRVPRFVLAARPDGDGMRFDWRVNVHLVREYRNSLVHERDDEVEKLSIGTARGYLCHFLSYLPPRW